VNGVLQGFAVIAVVVGVGYLVGRTGVLGEAAVEVLSRTAFFVATPALLFVILAGANVRAVFSEGLVVTAVTSTVVCLLYVPVGVLRHRPAGETALAAMASGYVNSGNLGLPIAAYALGDATAVVPVMLFQLAVMTPVFTTLLLKMLTRDRDDGQRSRIGSTVVASLTNPIALATFAGLVVSLTGIAVPGMILAPIKLIADLTVPAMLLAFGISLRGAALPGAGEERVLLGAVLLLKNVVHPALALGLGLLLGIRGHALLAVVVCAALPTAQNVFGYAVRFGWGVRLVRDAALTTTVLSVPVLFGVVALLT
jgi:malonate transporter and related proteins